MFREIRVEVKIREIKRLKAGVGNEGDIVWVGLQNEKDKREIWEKKKILKRSKIWIEDLTWKERKVRWKLKEIAKGERKKGRRCR